MTLTPKKQAKFLRKIILILTAPDFSEHDLSSVIGSCQHVCCILPARRSKLNGLYALRNRFKGTHPSTRLKFRPTSAMNDLHSWRDLVESGPVSASLQLNSHFHPHDIFTDASDFALGVVYRGQALSISLPADYTSLPGINIGVGEAWAFLLGIEALIADGARNCVERCWVDNQGVVFAARKGRSSNTLVNHILDTIFELAASANIDITTLYIRSADNSADAPSRGNLSGYAPLSFPHSTPWLETIAAARRAA